MRFKYKELLAITEAVNTHQTEENTHQAPNNIWPHDSLTKKKDVPGRKTRCTLIIKETSIIPGKEIESMLSKEAIAILAHIDRVSSKRNRLEVTCKSKEDIKKTPDGT